MTPTINLINIEQISNMIFVVASLYAIASAEQARQAELEKQQGIPSSGSPSAGLKSSQYALIATSLSVISYVIFTLVAAARKGLLEKEIQSGTTNASLKPIIVITIGFVISLLGAITRLPAIQQRIREAQEVLL